MDLNTVCQGLGHRPALIVVDMINGFTDPNCELGCACADVIAANRRLVQLFHTLALPVFFTTVVYRRPSDARVFRQRLPALNVLTPDSHWTQINAQLDMHDSDELVEKCWASAFFNTDLQRRLLAHKADSLVVTGLTTSGCVRATAVDGLQYDYPVVIPREAVGDRNIAAHEANLFDLNAKYADVLPLAEVTRLLNTKSFTRPD